MSARPVLFSLLAIAGLSAPVAAPATPASTTRVSRPAAAPVLRQIDWLVANVHRPVGASLYVEHFTPAFRAAVALTDFNATAARATGGRPIVLVGTPSGNALQRTFVARTADGQRLSFSISVEPTPPNRISGLLVRPAPAQSGTDAKSVTPTQLGAVVANAGPDLGWLVADVKGNRCRPIDGEDAGLPKAIGSAFKLYVLASLADAIEAKRVRWDESLTITDAQKSAPSGELQARPAGSTVTVEEAARLMISISDNTATDLLIRRVGRERIESDQRRFGATDPDRNIPFLTTRELFHLKLGALRADAEKYASADVAARRALLARVESVPLPTDIVARATRAREPLLINDLEWFYSMEDLCRVHARLRDRSSRPSLAPLAAVLGANPGIAFDTTRWPRVQFKGGSEPGVLALSWLVDRADGRRFFVGVAVANDAAPIDEAPVVAATEGVFRWLATRA